MVGICLLIGSTNYLWPNSSNTFPLVRKIPKLLTDGAPKEEGETSPTIVFKYKKKEKMQQ